MNIEKLGEYCSSKTYTSNTIDELLLMQSKGQRLTPEEKQRVLRYAENTRKQRKK
jgi:hypothetical protein